MLKKSPLLLILFANLSGCMYYAEYADRRADTGIKEQYQELLQAHAKCLRTNQNNFQVCPQPSMPKSVVQQ